jgi:CP2 transcription factor
MVLIFLSILLTIEPVDTKAANEKKCNSETTLSVDECSFDRFTVTWSSTSPQPAVYFCVRFLFLSTDFSHSKGVKGVPVRLVAKTEFLGTGESAFQTALSHELAYCKIKLFRDKGAERKLANDRQHLERAVEKLRQQAQQLTLGSGDSGQSPTKKKKRHSISGASGSEAQQTSPQRRHRRDWSISSVSSTASLAGMRSQQDEVQRKMDKASSMEAMFASIKPASAFSLIGDPTDDPSLTISPIAPQTQWEAPGMAVAFSAESEKANPQRGSPALSQTSFSSVTSDKVHLSASSPLHPLSPSDANARIAGLVSSGQRSQRVPVQAVSKEIDAMDVDPFYIPLPLPPPRPGNFASKSKS